MTFGQYLQEKRKERGITLRGLAESTGIAFGHLCDMENGNRPALSGGEQLALLVSALKLPKAEERTFYDLAAKNRDAAVPEDLSGYIKEESPTVVRALRTAKDAGAGVKEWEEFIKKMEEKKRGDGQN